MVVCAQQSTPLHLPSNDYIMHISTLFRAQIPMVSATFVISMSRGVAQDTSRDEERKEEG